MIGNSIFLDHTKERLKYFIPQETSLLREADPIAFNL